MELLYGLIAFIVAYGIGSLPAGVWVARYAGIGDIREHGSGNIGATNVLRVAGKKWGAITLLLDMIKGFLPVLLVNLLVGEEIAVWAGAAVVIGHIFPFTLGFKGGKGVATALGVVLALAWPLGCTMLVIWGAVFYLVRISSLSALISFFLAPFLAYPFVSKPLFVLTVFLSALITIKHCSNIKRLIRGEEHSPLQKDRLP